MVALEPSGSWSFSIESGHKVFFKYYIAFGKADFCTSSRRLLSYTLCHSLFFIESGWLFSICLALLSWEEPFDSHGSFGLVVEVGFFWNSRKSDGHHPCSYHGQSCAASFLQKCYGLSRQNVLYVGRATTP